MKTFAEFVHSVWYNRKARRNVVAVGLGAVTTSSCVGVVTGITWLCIHYPANMLITGAILAVLAIFWFIGALILTLWGI